MSQFLSADIEAELQEYIDANDLNRMFVGIVEAVLLEQPKNPAHFVVEYMKKTYPHKMGGGGGAGGAGGGGAGGSAYDESDSDDDSDDYVDELPPAPSHLRKGTRRIAVSAEAGVDPKALKRQWERERKVVPKSDEEMSRLRGILAGVLLFQNLDQEQMQIVVEAMTPVLKTDGQSIIQQGDEGDLFYVVEEGTPEVYLEKDGKNEKVHQYSAGSSFGELALMYNAPRAASVMAKGYCKLWAVDRLTFKVIVMETTVAKRDKYKGFLEKVPLLASLDTYERLTIADALSRQEFAGGIEVIRQGDVGDQFYIIESGELVCTQAKSPSAPAIEVKRYSAGDYFGEIALLTDEPRKATVTTLKPTVLLSLDRRTFSRVMGPLKDILSRNMEQYKKVMSEHTV